MSHPLSHIDPTLVTLAAPRNARIPATNVKHRPRRTKKPTITGVTVRIRSPHFLSFANGNVLGVTTTPVVNLCGRSLPGKVSSIIEAVQPLGGFTGRTM